MASSPPSAGPQQDSASQADRVRALAARLVEHHNAVDPPFAPESRRNHSGGQPARRRLVAVVGAGASHRAGLPLAHDSIGMILDRLRIDRALFEGVVSAVVTRNELELRRGEFETNLFAISLIPGMEDRLRDELQKLFSRGTGVLLTYEILAHLLKHRFLDAIVNFNFDELLDRAITDELQPDEFRYVWSDGHCPSPDEDPLNLPLYVKPHGTVSHKSTLRFTRRAYLGIPSDIRALLQSLLTQDPVTMLVIGFGMQSVEFNQILGGVKPARRSSTSTSSSPGRNRRSLRCPRTSSGRRAATWTGRWTPSGRRWSGSSAAGRSRADWTGTASSRACSRRA